MIGSGVGMSSQRERQENLVQVHEINQFVYCPRRLYYQKFFDTIGRNFELVEGSIQHDNTSRRGGWTKEMYLQSEKHGLHGKIDVVEDDDELVPVEHKRSESGSYFESDELQLAAYCMLLEENSPGSVNTGYIYTRSNDRRHVVRISQWHRDQIEKIVSIIQEMSIDNIPPITDNPCKCESCSTREYCMPQETLTLEPDRMPDVAWEEYV